MSGPLSGLKIIEIASIGPGPFCAMLMADQGAEVVRVDRKSARGTSNRFNLLNRGRKSIAVDLKTPEGIELVLRLIENADGLIEGFRPGVMERLGLGPEVCLERNPALVFGRMTGWGQSGPLARAAGHDINYIGLSGALHAIGPAGGDPIPPLNLVGDFGGGGMMLAYGMVCALLEAKSSGQGQIVDAAMTDGSALLMTLFSGMNAAGLTSTQRGRNLLDGGAHFYGVYRCADERFISIGSIEPKFYKLLLEKAGLDQDEELASQQMDPSSWPRFRAQLAQVFSTKTRDEWCKIMEGTDVCFAPVLDLQEAANHPHNRERKTFVTVDGIDQPAPAPRFSRTPGQISSAPAKVGEHTQEVLESWGWTETELEDLKQSGAI